MKKTVAFCWKLAAVLCRGSTEHEKAVFLHGRSLAASMGRGLDAIPDGVIPRIAEQVKASGI
jgi:hypothetical protein